MIFKYTVAVLCIVLLGVAFHFAVKAMLVMWFLAPPPLAEAASVTMTVLGELTAFRVTSKSIFAPCAKKCNLEDDDEDD